MMLLIGLLIGFLGYIMVGNINLSVMELSAHAKYRQLVQFIIVGLIFELLYCFGTLYLLQLLMAYPLVVQIAKYVSIIFLFVIGFWSIAEKKKGPQELHTNIVQRGYWSIIIHPQQISFWFFWGLILLQKNWIKTDALSLLGFSLANTLGAFLMFMCYAKWGNGLVKLLRLNLYQLKNIVGVFCIASACYLLYDLLWA